MNILVTGGAGFIGSHIVDLLLKRGHKVVVIDNLKNGSIKNVDPQAIYFKFDITSPSTESLFRNNRFDAVIHLAAHIDARASLKKPLHDAKNNIMGSLNILELSRKYGVKRFIYASSVAVYGTPQYQPIDEKHLIRPVNNYGISKQVVEHYLDVYQQLYGIEWVAFRFANVFGPRQGMEGEAGVIATFISRVMDGKPIKIIGTVRQTRDFIYVEDIANAVVKALSKKPKPRIMNLSTDKETTVNQLVASIQRQLKVKAKIKHVGANPGEVLRCRIDNRLAMEQLGWKPKIGVDEGISRIIAFFKNRSTTSKRLKTIRRQA